MTALPLLLPGHLLEQRRRELAFHWIASSTGIESTLLRRLRLWMLGVRRDPDQRWEGWPWFPGAAAWVMPTAFSILALERWAAADSRLASRVENGRRFLLARKCRDGGWNHGATHALGYEADSYPETTGVALLALHSTPKGQLSDSIIAAQSHLTTTRSFEAGSWLELALHAHGVESPETHPVFRGSTIELALDLLTKRARAGRNLLLE